MVQATNVAASTASRFTATANGGTTFKLLQVDVASNRLALTHQTGGGTTSCYLTTGVVTRAGQKKRGGETCHWYLI